MEQTTCYKCEDPITAPAGSVHPLCEPCDQIFMAWFNEQVAILDRLWGKRAK